MGRGNVCVLGESEGLIYIDYEDVTYYQNKYDKDVEPVLCKEVVNPDDYMYLEDESNLSIQCILKGIFDDFSHKFTSFTESSDSMVELESPLFTIEVEDNEWGLAIKLLQKEQSYYDKGNWSALQHRHYESYLKGLQECAFNYLDEIGLYGGPWTHSTLTKDEFHKQLEESNTLKAL